MSKSLFAVLLTLTVLGGTKRIVVAAEAPASWTGFYLGLHIGPAWRKAESRSGSPGAFDETPSSGISISRASVFGGGQVGYNWQVNNFVLGVEADGGHLGQGEEKFVVPTPDDFIRVKYMGYGTLAGRLGMAFGSILPYLKAGFAYAKIRTEAGDLIDGTTNVDTTDATRENSVRPGWTAGGGLEYALSRNWSLKGEYLYMDFGTDKSGNQDGERFKHHNRAHTLKFGVNYKF